MRLFRVPVPVGGTEPTALDDQVVRVLKCRTLSTFHVDRVAGNDVTMTSFEHGHP